MLDLINYFLTLNILDLGYDVFYYIKEMYPKLSFNINNFFTYIHNIVSYIYLLGKETILNIFII